MKVLVVGGGGREHALIWKIAQSPRVRKIFCAPGNAGIADLAVCVPIAAEDVDALFAFAKKNRVDLTVVGPEAPLASGIVDQFEAAGLRIFGASRRAAELESSKSFSKYIMTQYGIPTAEGYAFTSYRKAQACIRKMGAPIVVKADGLAAGKGVIVCASESEALDALKSIMIDQNFGDAGHKVVIEECLTGEEASFLAFSDGKTVLPLPSSQDHKPVYDDDKGPNTGGMGAYSPAPLVDRYMHDRVMNEVMIPTIRAMAAEGRPYKGILYAGLMISGDRIKVLEYNCRFGDPEAQPLLMRVKNDIVPLMEAVIDERLDQCRLELDERASVCVVMASGGYPSGYAKGIPISGLKEARKIRDVMVFHAGTALHEGGVVTSGGRVLGVTALGDTVEDAISKAYGAVSKIQWDRAHYRRDIGQKAVRRLNQKPLASIVMGSDSDFSIMSESVAMLHKFDIPFELHAASAHRTPHKVAHLAETAADRGVRVIIAGAGHAAHLAGVLAAHATIPVIGVPIDSSALNGLDALLATVQMPAGVPVATVSIGKAGARNAGILAAQILALSDPELAQKLKYFKEELVKSVERKDRALKAF
ncbi:MAG: phosphoribosylamine--glycine ligase [Desulfobacterales bacterium]|jgi:phosphoribosylamine--glycine ligase|nr:phosphoribosylamine--glycine ligase [Desulfobacterales bacterium]MDD3080899.1 phosphoribosylamine--glycine ligase [Desulfobacterales bacterium]MDY0378440.1 phosphoribosylamine--glycine ligase [Desulfobacterales bacterium]